MAEIFLMIPVLSDLFPLEKIPTYSGYEFCTSLWLSARRHQHLPIVDLARSQGIHWRASL